MSTIIIPKRRQERRNTAAALAALNEVLLDGEWCIETDTGKTKLGDGVTAYNSLRYLDTNLFAVASGTNTITATFASKPVLYDGLTLSVRAAAANTSTVTFNPNSIGAIAVTKQGGTALVAGDIAAAGHELLLRYVSSVPRWELLNPAQGAGGGGGGGAMTLVATATVAGSAVTSVTFSGLDLATDGEYQIHFSAKNATGTAGDIAAYYNADTTPGNYNREYMYVNGAGVTQGRFSDASLIGIPASGNAVGTAIIQRDVDGRPRAFCTANRDAFGSIAFIMMSQMWTNTANVTSITLTGPAANSLAVGSVFKLYKVT